MAQEDCLSTAGSLFLYRLGKVVVSRLNSAVFVDVKQGGKPVESMTASLSLAFLSTRVCVGMATPSWRAFRTGRVLGHARLLRRVEEIPQLRVEVALLARAAAHGGRVCALWALVVVLYGL